MPVKAGSIPSAATFDATHGTPRAMLESTFPFMPAPYRIGATVTRTCSSQGVRSSTWPTVTKPSSGRRLSWQAGRDRLRRSSHAAISGVSRARRRRGSTRLHPGWAGAGSRRRMRRPTSTRSQLTSQLHPGSADTSTREPRAPAMREGLVRHWRQRSWRWPGGEPHGPRAPEGWQQRTCPVDRRPTRPVAALAGNQILSEEDGLRMPAEEGDVIDEQAARRHTRKKGHVDLVAFATQEFDEIRSRPVPASRVVTPVERRASLYPPCPRSGAALTKTTW